MTTDIEQRFMSKILPEPNSGCWLWMAAVNFHGYGRFNMGKKRGGIMKSHRVAWEIYRGRIPEGLHVLHKCDIPACVNPDHLFLGTHTDNMQDMTLKGKNFQLRKTHCLRGHEFTESNIYPYRGYRHCRVCINLRLKKHGAKKRTATN